MPRARTGTLIPPGSDRIWRARITTTGADGSTWRPLYALGTTDKAQARWTLTRLVASSGNGHGLPSPIEANASTLRVSDYCET
jgi:hypothetical protein